MELYFPQVQEGEGFLSGFWDKDAHPWHPHSLEHVVHVLSFLPALTFTLCLTGPPKELNTWLPKHRALSRALSLGIPSDCFLFWPVPLRVRWQFLSLASDLLQPLAQPSPLVVQALSAAPADFAAASFLADLSTRSLAPRSILCSTARVIFSMCYFDFVTCPSRSRQELPFASHL